jgi:hypothetical protein
MNCTRSEEIVGSGLEVPTRTAQTRKGNLATMASISKQTKIRATMKPRSTQAQAQELVVCRSCEVPRASRFFCDVGRSARQTRGIRGPAGANQQNLA